MRPGRISERIRHTAACLVLLTAAWSGQVGRIGEDTKNDLYVDPWRFLARSLHLWDPQVTWGVLQNQGYGYLFPMGPFFGVVESVAPVWVAQRLWWSLILLVGYGATWRLLRALTFEATPLLHVAALAYALCPRLVTTLGGLSAEALPVALAPAILAPLVNARAGRITSAKAAAYSGVAMLCCGGVNATATVLAAVPAGLFLVMGRRWWRDRLVAWWVGAVLLATAWWLGPLLLLGGYSPPFLDWIENARIVAAPIGLFDVVRGTTHWLGFIVTGVGPWWPTGFELTVNPWLIGATALTATAGLIGLASRTIPHRRWLVLCLAVGALAIALPHSGPAQSPLADHAQRLLDGPLVPFRNIHKADPLVRLPMAIGLAHLLRALPTWRPVRGVAGSWRVLALALGLAVVGTASPAYQGRLTTPGTFTAMADHWVEAGRWLDRHAGSSRSLIVPAATFGEYTWGRTIDEPLRPLTDATYAVRDGVPLTPAGTIRLLDAIEQRLQTGQDLRGAATVLRRLGVRYLVLRNDLDATAAGTLPVDIARSAIRSSPEVRFAAGFGPKVTGYSGLAGQSVEIYELVESVAGPLEVWPMTSATGASGASEALVQLADAGLLTGPVVFDGDRSTVLGPANRIETDSLRGRAHFSGARRGQDYSSSLTASGLKSTRDYLPWPDPNLRSVLEYGGGLADLTASSSVATTQRLPDVRPAYAPFAAVDGDDGTGWLTYADPKPTLTITLASSREVGTLRLTLPDPKRAGFEGVSVPSRLRVSADSGSVDQDIRPGSRQVDLTPPGGWTKHLTITILETAKGPAAGTLTGLAEVRIPGVAPTATVVLADPTQSRTTDTTTAIALSAGDDGYGGCIQGSTGVSCVVPPRAAEESSVLARVVSVHGARDFQASGTLVADPLVAPVLRPLRSGVESVQATTSRTTASAGRPSAAFDADLSTAWSPNLGDRAPGLTVTFTSPTDLSSLRLDIRNRWLAVHRPVVRVTVDGREIKVAAVGADGKIDLPTIRGRVLTLSFVLDVDDPDGGASLEVAEVQVGGLPPAGAAQPIGTTCGDGPRLVVNDLVIPTKVTGPAEAAIGQGQLTWEACATVGLGFLEQDRIEVHAWKGTQVRSMVWLPADQAVATPVVPREATAQSPAPGTWMATMTAGPADRLLTLTENANAGWRATLAGTPLAPVTIDGMRQGFVIPSGAAGSLVVSFAPDRIYRVALGSGALLAFGLLATALAQLLRRRRSATEQTTDPVAQVVVPVAVQIVGALGFGWVMAGWPGLLTVSAALGAAALAGRRRIRLGLLIAGAMALGTMVTILKVRYPEIGPMGEVTTRLAALSALALVLVGSAVAAAARPSNTLRPPTPG